MATRELLAELASQYQQEFARAVAIASAGGVDVAKRVQGGEPVDVVVLAASAIDQLIKQGHLRAGSRVDLVNSGIAVAVARGAPKPDIATEDALKSAVLAARTLSFSTGPSGVYLLKLFERWGVMDLIEKRIVQAPPGVPVGSLVARGDVELGFQQLSELMNLPGISVVGPLPSAIQSITTFAAGISVGSKHADAARRLIVFMAAPAATPVKRRHGMEPA